MAAHLEEQQELDNFKYFWKRTGRWIFALLIVAALGYLGYTITKAKKLQKIRKPPPYWRKWWKRRSKKPTKKPSMPIWPNCKKNYPDSISTAQATLMVAATEFDDRPL